MSTLDGDYRGGDQSSGNHQGEDCATFNVLDLYKSDQRSERASERVESPALFGSVSSEPMALSPNLARTCYDACSRDYRPTEPIHVAESIPWNSGGNRAPIYTQPGYDNGYVIPDSRVGQTGQTVVSISEGGSNNFGNGGYNYGNLWNTPIQNQGDNTTIVTSGEPVRVQKENMQYGDFQHKTNDVNVGGRVVAGRGVVHETTGQPTYNDQTARMGVVFKGATDVIGAVAGIRNGNVNIGDVYGNNGNYYGGNQNVPVDWRARQQQRYGYGGNQYGYGQSGGDNTTIIANGQRVNSNKETIRYGDFEHSTSDIQVGGQDINGINGPIRTGRRGPSYNDETARFGVTAKGLTDVIGAIGQFRNRR